MKPDLVERLRSTLPVCPYDSRSPDYWTTTDDKPCVVCGQENTTEGPDKCRGADTRCMDEAADALEAQAAEIEWLKKERDEAQLQQKAWGGRLDHTLSRAEAAERDVAALKEEVGRLREALMSIAEHPGPFADDAAWCRVEDARAALQPQEPKP